MLLFLLYPIIMKTPKKQFVARALPVFCVCIFLVIHMDRAWAHCDSYAGPVIKDAVQALKNNQVALVYKWIDASDEPEIRGLFEKTQEVCRNGDKVVCEIAEQHFLETLVRLHRASEGASYMGLKPAESVEPIVRMSDDAIETGDIDGLLTKLNNHISKVVREKYARLKALEPDKDVSPEQGRRYVQAYVDYVHTVEGVHRVIEGADALGCVTSGNGAPGGCR